MAWRRGKAAADDPERYAPVLWCRTTTPQSPRSTAAVQPCARNCLSAAQGVCWAACQLAWAGEEPARAHAVAPGRTDRLRRPDGRPVQRCRDQPDQPLLASVVPGESPCLHRRHRRCHGLRRRLRAGESLDGLHQPGLLHWGRPNRASFGTASDDQYTLEAYYRFQPFQRLAITPDLQLIKNPPLNPADDLIWIAGLRARLVF
jgi:hypothetical protein